MTPPRTLAAAAVVLAVAALLSAACTAPGTTTPAPPPVAAQATTAPPADGSLRERGTATPPPIGHGPTVIPLPVDPYTTPPTVTGVFPPPGTCTATGGRPDRTCTPGSVATTTRADICVSLFSDKHRPSPSNAERAKTAALRAYGVDLATRATVELDHLVPLSLGGSNAAGNLWPEVSDIPGAGFRNRKDGVEDRVHAAVCRANSSITITAAQYAMAQDWTTALAVLGLPPM